MFTRASKAFFGLAIAAWSLAIVYGVITSGLANDGVVAVLTGDGAVNALIGGLTFGYKGSVGDHLGFAVLMGFAVSCLFAGGITSAFRDGNPEAVAELANIDASPAVAAPADLSPWPLVAAFGGAVGVLGLASSPALFAIGCSIAGIAALEWTIKAWSEAATGDPEVNRAIRNRLMYPLELPVGALVIVLVLGIAFSRLLLMLSKIGALVALSVGGIVILVGAVVLASRPTLRRRTALAAIVAVAVAFLVSGIWGAIEGPREFEKHGGGHHGAAASLTVGEGS